jgi:hypothetical protein
MSCAAQPNNESSVDGKVREAVGVFTDRDELEDAIEDLHLAGFDRDQIHLLASCRAVEAKLGHIISNVRDLEDEPNLPAGNYADRHERAEGAAALVSGLALLSSFAAVAGVAASGGTLAMTIAAAVAAGGVGCGFGALLVRALGKHWARDVEEQLRRGGLLLWVELHSGAQELKALEILQRHSGEDVHVHELTRSWGADEVRSRRWRPDSILPKV